MDTNSINWNNPSFPIKNADGSSFHNLVLHKAVFDSTVMSLGDKITGEVVYKDNTLAVTMQEYIEYKRNDDDDVVRYVLVNPPTIIREGMASDNSELKGMTKYSFEFYHPMYQLSNIPFTDVAVKTGEERYLAQNKTFSWIGNLRDYIDKLNKNLQGTQWVVVLNEETVPQDQRNKLSEVLSFDKNFVSEALKTAFDTWEVPFVIDSLHPSEYYDSAGNDYYDEGKRFFVLFGLPSNEIIDSDEQPFVFKMGQGVGLKNNSRTPKNNKIITRIVGYGSENNIPYGYPQIVWYGNPDWDYTINNQSGMQPVVVDGKTIQAMSYPIYKGIVGGQYVKLIKHPFTRTTLQPSIYSETVFNKVSPYLEGGTTNPDYNPDIDILDYYDAPSGSVYPNPIVPQAPSVEIHQFENEKPELGEASIVSDAEPYVGDMRKTDFSYESLFALEGMLLTRANNTSIVNEHDALLALHAALVRGKRTYHASNVGGAYTYECTVTNNGFQLFVDYRSDHITFTASAQYAPTPTDVEWDDTMDDDGKYMQSYFTVELPQLDFDLYACAAITQEMQINMRSGACIGCTFTVMVDWEDYKKNFYKDVDGETVFDPVIHTTDGDGHVRDGEKYPDSSDGSIELILQKDIETFGRIMPNIYQQPKSGDLFVILGISLPLSYITSAEKRLDDDMMEYMLENNVYYYEYPLKFDEHFLATHEDILKQMRNNTIVRFEFADVPNILYIKQMTIKYEESSLPRYDITLTDDVEIVLNQIGQVTDDVSRMRVQVNELQKYYGGGVDGRLNEKLSRISDDVALGKITFQQGLDSIASAIFHDELRSPQFMSGLYAGKGWKIDHLGNAEFESLRVRSFLEVVELLVNRMQAQEGDTLFTDNDQIEKVEKVTDETNGSVSYILSLKEKWDGYVTAQQYGNILKGIINTLAAKQSGVSHETTELLYYTSWMRVIATHNTDSNLKVNQIRVVLYGDDETPAQKNFEPCELMTIARWGCIDYSDPESEDYEAVKASIKRRQQVFYISTSEGRIVKLNGVDQPILKNGNYGTTLGELPDFVKQYQAVSERLVDGGDYLYAQGVVVGDFIKINKEGLPVPTVVFCGEWVDGSKIQNPTPRNGIYYYNKWNDDAQQYEIHEVRHNGCRWQCLQSQPVISGGVATYYEPKWNSDYWMLVDGSDSYDIVSSKGSAVIDAAATTMNFSASISFYVRRGGSRTEYSGYYIAYKRSNGQLSSIAEGTESSFTLTYNGVVCDAFKIRLFDNATTNKNRLAEFEIPVIKNGAKGDDGSTTNPNILVDTLEYKDASKWFNMYSHIEASESYQGRVVRNWTYGDEKNDGTYVRLAEQAIATNSIMRINPSTWYTLSVYARGNGSLILSILQGRWNCASYIDANGNEQELTQTTSDISITHTLTNEWKVYSFTFKTRDTIDVSTVAHYDYASIRLSNITSQSLIYFSMPKLEVGKVATAYIPNEEDLVGTGIRSVTKTRQFTLNFSEPPATGSGWVAATDASVQTNNLSSVNRYLWEKTVTEYTDTSVSTTTDIALIAQYIDGTHENILSGTQFLNQRDLAKWEHASGSIDSNNTYDGRNSFKYTPDVSTDNAGSPFEYDFLRSKAISGKMKPNTWYTFSFYLRIGNLLRVVGSATTIVTNKYYYVNQISGRKLYIHIQKNSNSAAVTMNVDENTSTSDSGDKNWTNKYNYQIQTNELTTIKISEVGYNRHIRIHFSDSFTCDYLALDTGSKVSSFVYPNAANTDVRYADGNKITSEKTWLGDSVSTTDQGVVIDRELHNGSLVYMSADTHVEWQGQWNWKRHSITFKTPNTLNNNIKVLFRDLWHSLSICIAMPKLEEGTIATEYVPANEDMKGDMGRNLYFAGNWDDLRGTEFVATDYQAPYVRTGGTDSTPTCYVFVGSNGTYQYPSTKEGYTGSSVIDWAIMTSDFKYLITQAVFAAFAHLGSAIFNGDFMFSQYGTSGGRFSDSYNLFNPLHPYDENYFRPKFMLNLLQGIISTSHLVTPFFHITSSNFNTVFDNRTQGSGYYVCEITDTKIAEYGANFALDGVSEGTPEGGILIEWTDPPEGVIVTLANNVTNRSISISTSPAWNAEVSVPTGEIKRAMAVMRNGNIIFVEI